MSAVWDFLVSAEGLLIWLGEIDELPQPGERYETAAGTRGEVRSARPYDRVRLTWQPPGRNDPAVLQFALVPTTTETSVRFHQEKLAGADERAARRAALHEALARIGEALSAQFAEEAAQ